MKTTRITAVAVLIVASGLAAHIWRRHLMRPIVFVLIAVVALAGVVAYIIPASGQAGGEAAPIFGLKIPPRIP
jgi:hypothetical protein